MGSQSVEIMRQGIWASLTGGWYYDPHQNVFCNTFHLYLWLYLVCVPFCVYLYASWWWLGWLSHLLVLAIISAGIKGTNYLLHHMFDTGESFEEEIIPETPSSDPFRTSLNSQTVTAGHQRTSSFEAMEMQVVRTPEAESDTPPVGCSSWNSIMDSSGVTPTAAVLDLKVDVHHKENSSGSEEGSLKKDTGKNDTNENFEDCQLSSIDHQQPCSKLSLRKTKIFIGSLSLDDNADCSSTLDPNDSHECQKSTCSLSRINQNSFATALSIDKVCEESDLTRNDKERLDLYGLNNRPYRLDSIRPISKGINSQSHGAPLTSRSCRATPDSLSDSPITGERSCSEPSCFIEEIDPEVIQQRLHYGSTYKHKDRRPRRKDNKTGRDRNKSTKVSDPDTEEEFGGTSKNSVSPLLNMQPGQELTCKPRKSKCSTKSSKVYHPLVCRATSVAKASATSSFVKDAVKVTTLTFENIYADDESSSDTPSILKFSNSSDEAPINKIEKSSRDSNSSFHQLEDSLEGNVPLKLLDTHISQDKSVVLENINSLEPESRENCQTDIVIGCSLSNASADLKDSNYADDLIDDDALSELSNNSSCPDIDWLFYHSESDSEFANVVKRQNENSNQKLTDDEDENDSWNVVRSSPECNSELVDDHKLNMRDPEGSSKQGAIPKQRRQGLVVSGCDDASQDSSGREAAGVTMDLVRKMLDVFSSYPENRPRDIKKLLVLVSLEQDRRGTRANESSNSEKDFSNEPYTPDLDEEDTPTLSPSDTIHSISTLTSTKECLSEKNSSSSTTILHRKPAIRRRRALAENIPNAETSTFNSDSSVCVEFSLNSKNNKLTNLSSDYQATLSGAMSFFGNSDDENNIGDVEPRKIKKCAKKSYPEDPILPLSAYGSLGSPAIHLATGHDDTSNGAVHCFQDERGHWFSYTFNNSGVNIASAVVPITGNPDVQRSLHRTTDLQSLAETHRGHPKDQENPVLATGDASLSSSSMSLCSGLTVVLDNQGPSPSSHPWPDSLKIPKDLKSSSHSASPTVSSAGTLRRISPPTIMSSHVRGGEEGRRIIERQRNREAQHRRMSTSSGPTLSRNPRDVPMMSTGQHHLHLLNLGTPGNPLQLFTNALFDRRRLSHRMHPSISITHNENFGRHFPVLDEDIDLGLVKQLKFTTPAPQTVQYYKLQLFRNKSIKVQFDRLSLLALLDRNLTIFESFVNIILIVLVGVLGCLVLFKGFYHEFSVFIFSVVMASCQYSLFKSVQPDAASPTHGYNHIILYSRPVYFCLCCSIVLALDFYLSTGNLFPSFHLYKMELTSPFLLGHLRDFLLIFILLFPIIFSLGLLPQINTFFMYVLEQIDIHIFGGNATTSLSSAIYCVFRSGLSVMFLLGFAYGGLSENAGSQHILYSIFCALIVAFGYHLSRSAANPSVLWQLIKKHMWPEELLKHNSSNEENVDEETKDPLPEKLRLTVTNRLMHDAIVCTLIAIIVCGIHSSTVFTVLLQGKFPDLLISVWIISCLIGLLNHYIIPQLRTQQPWMCIARPACMSHEYPQFEVYDAAQVMWFEKIYLWLCIIEKNIIYPVLFLCALTKDASVILAKHPTAGTLMIVICGLKCLRSVYSQPQFQYLIVAFTILFFNWDLKGLSESFLVDYFFMSIVFSKMYEFLLKLKFIVTYIAPWQITWGSAFHAFAQPFSVPHSAMLFIQAAISSVLSTPLNPILGSAIFVTSYVRPVKFWERDYNTKRMDQSNTRLSSLLEQNPGADDNNLNSIFYEHLTRSLQHSLCGDLIMGRWGPAVQGDCFVLASDNLNCLVHIIEVGNGLVTFQVRGLEFRGTYCQQREVEAISEGVEEDGGCCCCEPGHLPHLLSANAAFNQRWLAWEVTATKYVLEGYSISDNSATSMFQMFELRKILITYYVKSIIFYTVQSTKLEEWLDNEEILGSLEHLKENKFADLDPTFHVKIDEDFDYKDAGITRSSFCSIYLDWICFCVMKRQDKPPNVCTSRDSILISLCLALSLLGRRALGPSSQCDNVEVFLQFLHSLFKGDIRPTCVRDEWVFADMELLRKIVAPAVRMSLKLHQDHFLLPDEYDSHDALYSAILEHQNQLVICHEGDPAWRAAILAGKPSLLSLRHVNDDGEDKFKIIMLNKRHLLFRVIKINRECVRGLWAGQQQELVYLRNRNPERGSIQNAKQALRNIINSSCDQPIGYPIYVSPLTTSYADTHSQYCKVTGNTLTPTLIKESVINICNRLRERCVEGCSSGSSGLNDECIRPPDSFQTNLHLHQVLSNVPLNSHLRQDGSPIGGFTLMTSPTSLSFGPNNSLSRGSLQANRGSIMSTVSSNLALGHGNKLSSSTLTSLGGLLGEVKQIRVGESEGGSVNSKEWSGGRGDFHPRMGESSKERGSIHNSRDSLSYSAHHSLVWDPMGCNDSSRGDKRGRGDSRGSSVSGITFLSREVVAAGPLDQEWEMGCYSDRGVRATGSAHSLHSITPHSGGISHTHTNSVGSSFSPITQIISPPSPPSSMTSIPICGSSHSPLSHCSSTHSPISHCRISHSPIPHCSTSHSPVPHCSSTHSPIPHCSASHSAISPCTNSSQVSSIATSHSLAQINDPSLLRSFHPHHAKHPQRHQNVLQDKIIKPSTHSRRVRIIDANQVYDTLNLGRRIDVQWPDEWMRSHGGRSFWGHWVPLEGMEGMVVHSWMPYHPDPKLRSHVDKTILLVQIDDKFVPVAKGAVQDVHSSEQS